MAPATADHPAFRLLREDESSDETVRVVRNVFADNYKIKVDALFTLRKLTLSAVNHNCGKQKRRPEGRLLRSLAGRHRDIIAAAPEPDQNL